jgi:tetratricopeptide (TPR) repeat protein
MSERRWKQALESADLALSLDPISEQSLNMRGMILTQLGRGDEAADSINRTLKQNPESAVSHANRGWSLLHQSKPKEALEHFRESLRLDPGNAWARTGLAEALKARYFLYRCPAASRVGDPVRRGRPRRYRRDRRAALYIRSGDARRRDPGWPPDQGHDPLGVGPACRTV